MGSRSFQGSLPTVVALSRSAAGSGSPLKNRDFLLFWAGQSVSDLGASIMVFALPLVAVTTLGASTLEVGALTAAGTAAWLVMTLPAGTLVDRVAKRRLLICCGLTRSAAVISVPLAATLGHLTIAHLYVIALVVGTITVVFEVACQSYLPALLTGDRLTGGNGGIAASNAVAAVLGPSAGGGLMALFRNAPALLVVDCVTSLAGALSLLPIRTPEPRPARDPARSLRAETAEGITFVLRQPVLRRIVACSAVSNAGDTVVITLVVVFLLQELGAGPPTVGLVMGASSVGGVIGGLLATPLARRLGSARALWSVKLCAGAFTLLIPFGRPGWGIAAVATGLFALRLSTVAYNVLQVTYRQSICPAELLGRMNATVRWMIRGAIPVSGLLAGVLGTWLGLRATLAVAVVGSWLSVSWIVFSPLRGHRDFPRDSPA
ncbi:MFS transporter [Nonomuraea sp. NN258]|uniref:MFS transporter n=1 Tax=Nonomuraea antri TaxID=2730852 RepID=UPI001569F1B7|nr:MFS transporter [Nonomuraea antri]NRQ39196.1 MFS transporter [Nonomuraea antri]